MGWKFRLELTLELIGAYIMYGLLVAMNFSASEIWRYERKINGLKLMLKV